MKLLLTIIIVFFLYEMYQKVVENDFNLKKAFLYGFIGIVLGSSLGVAGFGRAIAGWSVFGSIGFYIGGTKKEDISTEKDIKSRSKLKPPPSS